MQFFIKKIFIFLFACFILGILGGSGYYFFKSKFVIDKQELVEKTDKKTAESKELKSTEEDETINMMTEEERKICFSQLEGLSDDELIDEAKNIRYPNFKISENSKNRQQLAQKELLKYLINRYETKKTKVEYNKIKNYISEMLNFSEEDKINEMTILESIANDTNLSFTKMLAIADYNIICPTELGPLCINRGLLSGAPIYEEWCQNLCNDIIEYPKNIEKYKKEIVEFLDWQNDISYAYGQSTWRASMAYRLEGKEEALGVCNNLYMDDVKYKCIDEVNEYDDFNPQINLNNFIELICT